MFALETVLTKEEMLWERLRHIGTFNSHTVREIGFMLFYDRADRTVRRWAEETEKFGRCKFGKAIRLTDKEAKERGLIKAGNQSLACWDLIVL